MNKKKFYCRVCGKQFRPCSTRYGEIGFFNYREVACSPECGEKYLEMVMEARTEKEEIDAEESANIKAEEAEETEESEEAKNTEEANFGKGYFINFAKMKKKK